MLFADDGLHRSNEQSSRTISNCTVLIVRWRSVSVRAVIRNSYIFLSFLFCVRVSLIISFVITTIRLKVYTLESPTPMRPCERRHYRNAHWPLYLKCYCATLQHFTERLYSMNQIASTYFVNDKKKGLEK